MPSAISELVLKVKDLRAATEFYREVVGLELERPTTGEWAWFKLSASPLQRLALHKGSLLFEEHSERPPELRFGPTHFAFQVTADELRAARQRLERAKIEVYGPVALDWMNADSIYFYDPDDNLVELWCARE